MSTDDPTEAYDAFPDVGEDDIQRRLDALPSMNDDPVVWDAAQSKFVPASEYAARQRSEVPNRPADPPPNRHVVVEPGAPDRRAIPGATTGPGRAGAGPAGAAGAAGASTPRGRTVQAPPQPPTRRKVVLAGGYKRRLPWPLRWLRRLVVGWLLIFLFVGGGLLMFGWAQFNKLSKAPVGSVLSAQSDSGTNYLIVGTDSREGIDPASADAKAFLGPGEAGGSARTDTILVLRVEGDRRLLLSIPRDLWVRNPKSGEMGRINSVFQDGPSELVKAVQALGIPIHHYFEVNFVSFGSLIDAVGGIDIEFAHAARDSHSGLWVPDNGVQHLNGSQALAFVRSRFYEEAIDGKWVTSGAADLDRVKRQQAFLKALVLKLAEQKNPSAIAKTMSSLGGGLRIDERFGYFDALSFALGMRSFSPESRDLKVWPRKTTGGADVLDLLPVSAEVIKEFQ